MTKDKGRKSASADEPKKPDADQGNGDRAQDHRKKKPQSSPEASRSQSTERTESTETRTRKRGGASAQEETGVAGTSAPSGPSTPNTPSLSPAGSSGSSKTAPGEQSSSSKKPAGAGGDAPTTRPGSAGAAGTSGAGSKQGAGINKSGGKAGSSTMPKSPEASKASKPAVSSKAQGQGKAQGEGESPHGSGRGASGTSSAPGQAPGQNGSKKLDGARPHGASSPNGSATGQEAGSGSNQSPAPGSADTASKPLKSGADSTGGAAGSGGAGTSPAGSTDQAGIHHGKGERVKDGKGSAQDSAVNPDAGSPAAGQAGGPSGSSAPGSGSSGPGSGAGTKGSGAGSSSSGADGAGGKPPAGSSAAENLKDTGSAAARGAAQGAAGGAQGMAAGAAKEVGKSVVDKGLDQAGIDVPGKDGDKGGSGTPGLGAAGTSLARGRKGETEPTPLGKKAKRAAVAGGVAAAPPAAALIGLLAFLNWLKSFFFSMLAKAAGLLQAIGIWIAGVAKSIGSAIASPFVAIGTGIANFFAGGIAAGTMLASATAMTISVSLLFPLAVIGAIGGLFGLASNQMNSRSDAAGNYGGSICVQPAGSTGESGPVEENKEQMAIAVYSVFKSWGMPDENIAGILGNWTAESGIDPTSVEGIFDEPYQIGPRKQAAWDTDFGHMGYVTHSGIGLGQWTNDRNRLLIDYAEKNNADWFNIGLQLKFMADPAGDNPSDVNVVKDMIRNSQGTPANAAFHFHDRWERSADTASMKARRAEAANMWFARMSGWTVDEGLVDSLVGDFVAGIDGILENVLTLGCKPAGGSGEPGELVPGGLSIEESQAIIDLYLEEGDVFLDGRYGNRGGPGSCGDDHRSNCVSFTTYFMNKYTSFQQYAPGNGNSTARSLSSMTGLPLSSTPTPYSVFSYANGGAGHTAVVMGVNEDDSLIVAQAGYCRSPGEVVVVPAAEWKSGNWDFIDVSSLLVPADEVKTS